MWQFKVIGSPKCQFEKKVKNKKKKKKKKIQFQAYISIEVFCRFLFRFLTTSSLISISLVGGHCLTFCLISSHCATILSGIHTILFRTFLLPTSSIWFHTNSIYLNAVVLLKVICIVHHFSINGHSCLRGILVTLRFIISIILIIFITANPAEILLNVTVLLTSM